MFDITESSIIAALIGLFGSMLFLFGFLWTFYLGRKRLGLLNPKKSFLKNLFDF